MNKYTAKTHDEAVAVTIKANESARQIIKSYHAVLKLVKNLIDLPGVDQDRNEKMKADAKTAINEIDISVSLAQDLIAAANTTENWALEAKYAKVPTTYTVGTDVPDLDVE